MRTTSLFRRLGTLALATVAMVSALLLTQSALADGSIVDLGKPVDVTSTNSGFPLSGFHRVGKSILVHGKARFVFIGTLSVDDSSSAAERWSVLKALDQFGQLAAVKAIDRRCKGNGTTTLVCALPTFDWSHARYRSTYVVFEHKDILGLNGSTYFQRLSPIELALYNRYARVALLPGLTLDKKRDPYAVRQTIMESGHVTRGLPLMSVAGYVQTASQDITPGDFEAPPPGTPQTTYAPPIVESFATIQHDLQTNRDPTFDHTVEDVNAEANIMTALVCHADGMKPKSVCGRGVIKTILKSVK